MVQDLARRIREMAKIVDEEHIAKALNIPLGVVKGVLSGEMPDEILKDYDPARPPDVRVVERKKFVRSKIIGVVSTGGSGATTLAASLSIFSAKSTKDPVAVVDLNEFSGLGYTLGLDVAEEKAAFYPNVSWWKPAGAAEGMVQHPSVENLSIVLGAATAERHLELKSEVVAACLKEISEGHAVTWVDCPSWPGWWKAVVPLFDILLFVVRPDAVSLFSLWQAMPVLKNWKEKMALVICGDGLEDGITASECRRMLRKITDAPVVAVLPEEPCIRKAPFNLECYALNKPNSPYCLTVKEMLNELLPNAGTLAKKQSGVLNALVGLFRKD